MDTSVIRVARLSKRFRRGRAALAAVDLGVAAGEMVALIGPSGSGKSTLLRHLAGLVCGDAGDGEVVVAGRTIQRSGRIASDIRRSRAGIGMIFQQFHLVARLPVLTNVLTGSLHRLPWWRTLPGVFPQHEREQAMRCLHRVGMAEFAAQRASTLSGGQQQRVAIARALHQGARVILADEPIASLDPASARRVMEILAAINREDGVTVVVSLHQVDYARAFCPRAVALRSGRVVFDGPSQLLDDARLGAIYEHGLGQDPDRPDPRPAPALAPALARPPRTMEPA